MMDHERENSPKWKRTHIFFCWFCIEEIQNCQDIVLESYLTLFVQEYIFSCSKSNEMPFSLLFFILAN